MITYRHSSRYETIALSMQSAPSYSRPARLAGRPISIRGREGEIGVDPNVSQAIVESMDLLVRRETHPGADMDDRRSTPLPALSRRNCEGARNWQMSVCSSAATLPVRP